MNRNIMLYICIGCAVVSSVACFVFAVTGFWVGVFVSPLATICLWTCYYLLGRLDECKQVSQKLHEIAMRKLEENCELKQKVNALQLIIDGKVGNETEG